MIEIYDDILKEELARITPLDRATIALTDGIAAKIDAVMNQKGITKSQLAKMTGHRPCEVTKWLGGDHNFTCRTIALISEVLGTNLVKIVWQGISYVDVALWKCAFYIFNTRGTYLILYFQSVTLALLNVMSFHSINP